MRIILLRFADEAAVGTVGSVGSAGLKLAGDKVSENDRVKGTREGGLGCELRKKA